MEMSVDKAKSHILGLLMALVVAGFSIEETKAILEVAFRYVEFEIEHKGCATEDEARQYIEAVLKEVMS